MKKIFSIFLSFCLAMSAMFMLSGCKDDNGNSEESPKLTSFQISYMSDLMINVEQVTAFGIKKNIDSDSKVSAVNVSFVSDVVNDNSKQKKPHKNYYLYSTTESYEYGNVEYDKNTISKVTFKKNTSINKDVYDKDGNLITSETQIEQNDIDSQINKIYTTKQYTFMQFVACVESSGNYNYKNSNDEIKTEYVTLRPDSLTYDANGVAEFDKTDYFSGNLTASFVIDNSTGYIYKIENFHIKSFKNSLVVDDNGYFYTIKIDSENNLVFTDIMPNKEVQIKGVALDADGYIYVCNNNGINSTNHDDKIIYFDGLSYDYMIANNSRVYKVEREGEVLKIKQKFVNGVLASVSNDETVYGLEFIWDGLSSQAPIAYYKQYNVYDFYPANSYIGVENSLKIYNSSNTYVFKWFNFDLDFITYTTHDNYLYYKYVNIDDYLGTNTTVYSNEFNLIANKKFYSTVYYQQIGDDFYEQINVYKSVEIYGTEYYKLVKKDNKLELVKIDSITYEDNIFIFQPINKN